MRDVSIEFDQFIWDYNKTSFPSLKDTGSAKASVVDLDVTVKFDLATDEQKRLTVRDLSASVDMAR
jgi:hypothetical protein